MGQRGALGVPLFGCEQRGVGLGRGAAGLPRMLYWHTPAISQLVRAFQVELRTGDVCGLNMSAANLYRWHPAYAAGD